MRPNSDKDVYEFMLKHGKRYIPRLLPHDIPRGKFAHCFDNCAKVALDRKYRYVEGVAQNPKTGEWIMHAWLTDGKYAYDPTWKAYDDAGQEIPFPSLYIGREMEVERVAAFMMQTQYAGIFPNAHRAPRAAREAIGV